jgi:hypothetical protein
MCVVEQRHGHFGSSTLPADGPTTRQPVVRIGHELPDDFATAA